MTPAYTRYTQTDISTANPCQIVLKLYDGAIRAIGRAVDCTAAGDLKAKNTHIARALDIIVELNNSLDLETGGEIARNLKQLYFFMQRHLTQANWRNQTRGMQEVHQLLSNLREAWQEAYRLTAGERAQHQVREMRLSA